MSAGAKLHLVLKSSSPTVVEVALQIPDGTRLTWKFSSETTLWKVLRQFESGEASAGKNLNITGRGVAQTDNGAETGSGQIFYQTPVLMIMNREYSNMEDFQKTLSQIGINSGRTLLRLSFRNTNTPLHEAMENVKQYMDEVEPEGEKSTRAPAALQSEQPSIVSAPEDIIIPDAPPAEPVSAPEAAIPQEQPQSTPEKSSQPRDFLAPVHVYSAPTGDVPAAVRIEEDDRVYELGIADAKRHQERLKSAAFNKRLKSDQELAAEAQAEAARLAAVKSLTIRVRFPDQNSATWDLPREATGATVYAAVRGSMAHPDQKFRLVLPGPGGGVIADREGRQQDFLVNGYKLRGNVLLNLTWDDSASEEARRDSFLKDVVASKAEQIPIPTPPVDEVEEEEEQVKKPAPPSKPSRSDGGGGASAKLSKFLKLSKK